jgi:hypothetical protein
MQPQSNLSPEWSWTAIWVIALAIAAYCFSCVLRYFRMRKIAALTIVQRSDETIVSGVVEFALGQNQAIRVEVDETGIYTPPSKSKPYWTWTEHARRVLARPFYVRTRDGARIRIEPDSEVLLADKLDNVQKHSNIERTRSAELVAGEPVWVHGACITGVDPEIRDRAQGYRSGPMATLVLRKSGRRKLIVATEPLPTEFLRYAGGYARFAWASALLLSLFVGTVAVPYLDRATGQAKECTVLSSAPERNKGSITGYSVTCTVDSERLNSSLGNNQPPGTRLAAQIGSFSSQIGQHASVHTNWLLAALALLVALAIWQSAHVASLQPWYRKTKVTSTEDTYGKPM